LALRPDSEALSIQCIHADDSAVLEGTFLMPEGPKFEVEGRERGGVPARAEAPRSQMHFERTKSPENASIAGTVSFS